MSRHWTEERPEGYAYSIATDVTEAVITRMGELKWSRSRLAARLNLSRGRVSQVLNNPGSASLPTLVRFARAVGLKISLVAYRDGDPRNTRGPIHGGVFQRCWEGAGRPQDFWHWHNDTALRETASESPAEQSRNRRGQGIGPPAKD